MRVLILGGTGEARALARRLVDDGAHVTTSLAGRVSRPALPAGDVRIGGFGGTAGLVEYLQNHRPDAVVDATHPFAATITAHAVQACATAATPLIVLRRPGWSEQPGDSWTWVPGIEDAAAYVRTSPPGAVFLTTGRRDLHVFAADDVHDYLVRTVDPPSAPTPPRMTLLLDRGPYDVGGETALMREHGVGLLVTKDSGGVLTSAKLAAARQEHIPVVVVARPAVPDALVVDDVDGVLAWLSRGSAEG